MTYSTERLLLIYEIGGVVDKSTCVVINRYRYILHVCRVRRLSNDLRVGLEVGKITREHEY